MLLSCSSVCSVAVAGGGGVDLVLVQQMWCCEVAEGHIGLL